MSYVDRYWDEQLVTFPFSPKPPEPEVIIREVVREAEENSGEGTNIIHPPCPLGKEFDEWCHDHLLLTPDMERTDVKRDIVLLTEQYRVYFKTADRECRSHTTPNYRCIFHVFQEWMDRLEKKDRSLIPSQELFFEREETDVAEPLKDMTLGESLDEAGDEEQNW